MADAATVILIAKRRAATQQHANWGVLVTRSASHSADTECAALVGEELLTAHGFQPLGAMLDLWASSTGGGGMCTCVL